MKKIIVCAFVFLMLFIVVSADLLPEYEMKHYYLDCYVMLGIDNVTDEKTTIVFNNVKTEYTKVKCITIYNYQASSLFNDHRPSYLKEIYIPTISTKELVTGDIILTRALEYNSGKNIFYYCPAYANNAEYIKFTDGKVQLDATSLIGTQTLEPFYYLNYTNETSQKSQITFEDGVTANSLILWLNKHKNNNDRKSESGGTDIIHYKDIEKTVITSWQRSVFNTGSTNVYEYADYCTKYITDFYGIESFVSELVDRGTLEKWLRPFYDGERSLWELTIFSAVHEMNIPQNALAEANKENGNVFSDEQINALYSGDPSELDRAFASPWTLNVNGKLFTPDWLSVHAASDYEKNGITFDLLYEYIKRIDLPELAFACVPIAFAMEEMNKDFDPYSIGQVQNAPYPYAFYIIPNVVRKHIDNEKYEQVTSRYIVEGNDSPKLIGEFNLTAFNQLFSKDLETFNDEILDDKFTVTLLNNYNNATEKEKYKTDKKSSDPNYIVGEKDIALSYIALYKNYMSHQKANGFEALCEKEYYSDEEYLAVQRYRERHE